LSSMVNLVKWEWGARAFFAHSKAKQYAFSRENKPQKVLIKKYELVQKGLQMASKIPGLIDGPTVSQLVAYQAAGVYNENAQRVDIPIVGSKSS